MHSPATRQPASTNTTMIVIGPVKATHLQVFNSLAQYTTGPGTPQP